MRCSYLSYGFILLSLWTGCSKGPTPAAKAPKATADQVPNLDKSSPAGAGKDVLLASTDSKSVESEDQQKTNFVVPFDRKRDLFKAPPAPPPPPTPKKEPEPVKQLEPQPAPVPVEEDVPPPPVRLVGFVETDELSAMLSIANKPFLVQQGETQLDVLVVAISPPTVDLKFGDHEWSIDLFKQPMKNPSTSSGPVFSSTSSGSRPTVPNPRGSASSAFAPASLPPLPGMGGTAHRAPATPSPTGTTSKSRNRSSERNASTTNASGGADSSTPMSPATSTFGSGVSSMPGISAPSLIGPTGSIPGVTGAVGTTGPGGPGGPGIVGPGAPGLPAGS